MNPEVSYKRFLQVFKIWEGELNHYTLEELCRKPHVDSWSLGQVYLHLIDSFEEFRESKLDKCLQSNENHKKKKNFRGFLVLTLLKSFPPVKIKFPTTESTAFNPVQPESKEEIREGLQQVKNRMGEYRGLLIKNKDQGKAPHPVLSYLDGNEWYMLSGLHFQHHLRQKKRLDLFLGKSY